MSCPSNSTSIWYRRDRSFIPSKKNLKKAIKNRDIKRLEEHQPILQVLPQYNDDLVFDTHNGKYKTEVQELTKDEGGGFKVYIEQLGSLAFVADGDTLQEAFDKVKGEYNKNEKSIVYDDDDMVSSTNMVGLRVICILVSLFLSYSLVAVAVWLVD